MPTSMLVITASARPIRRYSAGPGCGRPPASVSWPAWSSVRRYSARVMLYCPLLLNQVDQREDHDPNDIDEVPVEPGQLHVQALLLRDPSAQRHDEERHQDEHPNRHVRPVEAREQEERGAKEVGLHCQAFTIELGELVGLTGKEGNAQ